MNTKKRHTDNRVVSSTHHIGLDAMQQILADYLNKNLPPPPPNCKYSLQKLLAYVHKHLFDPDLNCTQALRACGLGDHNITSQFRLEMGCSLKAYIEQHRLLAAQALMIYTNESLMSIADAVGYQNLSTFSDAFYRVYHQKPSVFKRLHLENMGNAENIEEKNRV